MFNILDSIILLAVYIVTVSLYFYAYFDYYGADKR